jgi:hypothetical protein
MRGFFAFAICFALLLQVWHEQYRYFRRYNLQDSISLVLNCILLFLVLFYVYPLKFLFTFLVKHIDWRRSHRADQGPPASAPDGNLQRRLSGGIVHFHRFCMATHCASATRWS